MGMLEGGIDSCLLSSSDNTHTKEERNAWRLEPAAGFNPTDLINIDSHMRPNFNPQSCLVGGGGVTVAMSESQSNCIFDVLQ